MHPSIICKGGLVGSITLACSDHGCPLCPRFKTRSVSAVKRHMENHKSNGVHFQDTVLCRCNQPCRDGGHFHCPFCPRTIVCKEDAETHVSRCKETQMQRPAPVPPHMLVNPRLTQHKENVQRPPSIQCLKDFIEERLTAVCEEIFSEVHRTVVQYEEEISRHRRRLDVSRTPDTNSHITDLPQQHDCEEEEGLDEQQVCNQERSSSLDQEDPEPPQIKEEQEEVGSSQEGDQLGLKQEAEGIWTDEERARLLENIWKPEIKSDRIDLQQQHVCEEGVLTEQQVCNQERNSGVDLEDAEPPQLQEEQEELGCSQEGEQLGLKQEADAFMVAPTYEESDHSEAEPSNEQLLAHSSPETESRDQEESQRVDSGSTRNAELKKRRPHRKRVRRQSVTESHEPEISRTTEEDPGNQTFNLDPESDLSIPEQDHDPIPMLRRMKSEQMGTRGCSPTRKGSLSGMKHKRRCVRNVSSPAAKSKYCPISKPGVLESENPTPDLGQNLPASSPLRAVVDGSLSIAAATKNKNGSRMYNKKQYCLYCKTATGKIARHLEDAHSNKPEVALAFSFPKGSKQRRMNLEHLRNRGNFAHNVDVLNAGFGDLVPCKKPKKDSQAQNFLHCVYCQGFFTKKRLPRHMSICKFKPCGEQPKKQALCASAALPPPGVTVELWKLLNNMVQDEVCSAVKSDVCIMEYGEHLYIRLGHDVGKHEYIRQKLRDLGRLLICSRKITPLNTIEDHIKPVNFLHVVQAVKHLAGYDSETNRFKCPSVALKLGYSLTKISLLVESRAKVNGDSSAAKDAHSFRRVYEAKWNELIPAASLRTLQESKWNAPLLLSFTKDIQTLHSYLDAQQKHFHSKLSTEASPQAWSQLTKLTLTQVVLINRQRAAQVSKIPLSVYLSQNSSDPQDDVDAALSNTEKKLCHHFRRIEIRGKRGRKVPVLLTPPMQQALDLLIRTRQECGVPQENVYLFAKPHALSCYRGSDCLRHFAGVCGAESPESLTSAKLRKQTATLSQVLNLTDTALDQLADFLGRDIRAHQQFHRLPEGTLQLAKISKVLMALEQGRLTEFKGKTLDDISIDPEENVPIDSDTEMVDSDSQDLQQQHVCEEEEVLTKQHVRNPETNSSLNQEGPEPPQIKEEQEVCCRSQEGEQLAPKQEAEGIIVWTGEERLRLLKTIWKPEIRLHRIDLRQQHVCEEVLTEQQICNQERNSSLGQEDPQNKEGQKELCSSQFGLKQEADALIATPTYEERGHTESESNSEQLLSHSFPEAKNRDQEESQHVNSGSTRNAGLKKRRHHKKKSHNTTQNSCVRKSE